MQQRALACTRLADNCNHLSFCHMQAEIAKELQVGHAGRDRRIGLRQRQRAQQLIAALHEVVAAVAAGSSLEDAALDRTGGFHSEANAMPRRFHALMVAIAKVRSTRSLSLKYSLAAAYASSEA